MHPQITSIQASAHDAFSHTPESAGALAFGNEHSGSAALPAPYNAFAERTRVCPARTLKPYAYKQWEPYDFGQGDRVPFA